MEGFEPLGHGHRHSEPLGDIHRDMIPTKTQRIRIDHMLLDKDRQPRGAPAEINASGAKLLLVFDKRGHPGHIGTRGQTRELQITTLDTIQKVLNLVPTDRQHMHVDRQTVSDLVTRVGQA